MRLVWTKYGGVPHWEHDAVLLGEDAHGTWLGVLPGTVMTRPGAEFRTEAPHVICVAEGAPHVASFFAPGRFPFDVYVDICTAPVWDGTTVTAVDLDLDVLRGRHGRVWVDDEDEFAEHQRTLGYPQRLVDLAVRSCAAVQTAVSAALPPYDGATAARWLAAAQGLAVT